MKKKGLANLPNNVVIVMLVAVLISFFFLMFMVPTVKAQETAASCSGMLKYIGALLADITGVSMC